MRFRLLIWISAGAAMAMMVGALVLYAVNLKSQPVDALYRPQPMNLVMALTFAPFGALILQRKPRHVIGWIFLAIGLGQGLGQLAKQYSYQALAVAGGGLPLGPFFYHVQDLIWFPTFWLIVFLLALFPTGQLASPRWKWLGRAFAASAGLIVLSRVVVALIEPAPRYFDPQAEDVFTVGDTLLDLALLVLLAALPAAAFALYRRLRRSSGVERQQLKWFSFAGIIFVAVFSILSVLSAWPVLDPSIAENNAYRAAHGAARALFPISAAGIPLAVAMAILRYRLYDIDLVIRKTLIYTVLSLALGLVYLAGIVSLQWLFTRLAGQPESQFAIILSTLGSAALFTPLRSRIQAGIDRRFYRMKYDLEQALSAFGASLRDEVELDSLAKRIQAVVHQTLQPESVSIWLLKPQVRQEGSPGSD